MSWQEDGGLSWPCELTCEKQETKSIECNELRFANHSTAFVSGLMNERLKEVPPNPSQGITCLLWHKAN